MNRLVQFSSLLALLFTCVLGIKVDRVHFLSDTEWATNSPVTVMCDVTLDKGEEVREVKWHHEGDLVYRWSVNETVQIFGVLEERVEYPSNDSDWNIKVNRLNMVLEGNFTCTAVTQNNASATNSFTFIIFCTFVLPLVHFTVHF